MENNQIRTNLINVLKLVKERAEEVRNLVVFLNGVNWEKLPFSKRSRGNFIEHAILVSNTMLILNESLGAGISEESLVICGMFHDIGKLGVMAGEKFYPRYLVAGNEIVYNKEVAEVSLGVMSLHMLSRFVPLNQEEIQAIVSSAGLYTSYNEYLKYRESTITLILQWADYWVSHVVEKGDIFKYDKSYWR